MNGVKLTCTDSKSVDDDNAGNKPQLCFSEGNTHFIHKRFSLAIASYTRGLSQDSVQCKIIANDHHEENDVGFNSNKSQLLDPVSLELLSNRAAAYLAVGNFGKALEDCQRVLRVSPTHFKACLRKAKALAGLAEYHSGITFVEATLARGCSKKRHTGLTSEHRKELSAYLEKLKGMKHQAETGAGYDVLEVMEKPHQPAPADWVDFIGKVKVESFPGKGRGLVAAEDLPPGQLILACRAFDILFLKPGGDPEKELSRESYEALHSGEMKVEDDPTLNFLARKIYDGLVINPQRRAAFYQLHAGNELGHLDLSKDPKDPPPPLDMARIYGICRTNTFANSGDSYPEVEKSVGVWLYPSYVNHLCIGGNCTWKIFSDFIFVRTYKSVKQGEEIIHSYVSPAYPYRARTEMTSRLGFVCPCVLCNLDRSLPKMVLEEKAKLKQLVFNQEVTFSLLNPSENSEEYAKKFQASVYMLEQIIRKLELISPKHNQYNASLLDPLQKLGLKYFGVGEFRTAATIMERACFLMENCMLPHGVADCALWVVASYIQMGDMKQAKRWGKILRDNLVLAFGDARVLTILGSWLFEPMTQWGLMP